MSDARIESRARAAWPDLPGSGAADLAPEVRQFLVALRQLSMLAWIEASMSAWRVDADAESVRETDLDARRALRRAVDEMPRTARFLRTRIEFLASVAKGFAGRAAVAAMTDVALVAALALAARERLSEADFARLYEPFSALIPFRAAEQS